MPTLQLNAFWTEGTLVKKLVQRPLDFTKGEPCTSSSAAELRLLSLNIQGKDYKKVEKFLLKSKASLIALQSVTQSFLDYILRLEGPFAKTRDWSITHNLMLEPTGNVVMVNNSELNVIHCHTIELKDTPDSIVIQIAGKPNSKSANLPQIQLINCKLSSEPDEIDKRIEQFTNLSNVAQDNLVCIVGQLNLVKPEEDYLPERNSFQDICRQEQGQRLNRILIKQTSLQKEKLYPLEAQTGKLGVLATLKVVKFNY